MKELKIGDLLIKVPVIQGGMGIGISRSSLASAVSNAGGLGVISGINMGYDEEEFSKNPLATNLKALKKHIQKAKELCNNKPLAINLMVAMNFYEEHVKAAIDAGIDLIISGAGLPVKLPKFTEGSNVKIAPIVSSTKACKLLLKMWDKKYSKTADMIVVEGPKAGGHLGFHEDELKDIDAIDYDGEFLGILKIAEEYGQKYNKDIPVIAAGGISTSSDVKKYIDMGASGVQVGTRFVATEECDADINFKNAYVNCKKEDIEIVKSPVGLPGRAIHNKFLEDLKTNKPKIDRCYNCMAACKPSITPYCISQALINAVNGDIDNALIFCGSDAYKIDKIQTVKEVVDELTSEIL
ncbi:NAD(P)H-dependent flavin oxidoreductase [Intestinibacter sp.]|uniref:NAD(P)H-dependent flavin oxidoreductase n=1 Tax=Intestinibacter sp. TaxID=1965304 RepID=UPI002A756FBC|nr:nitronate monooxygenase family protein [Intestinibacter sp.]MDY2736027.1 nitronate monooxygenase family protein [Intestinibacter sp.]MDY4575476.1 nitronate monooxygenase family protein [Intestinibacter sp.]